MTINVPEYIIIHHTVSGDVSALDINQWHKERGWGRILRHPLELAIMYASLGYPYRWLKGQLEITLSIGYHAVIRENGKAEIGRPSWMPGAHCKSGNMNFKSLGVALTGHFIDQGPTPAQMASLQLILRLWLKEYRLSSSKVLGHWEVAGSRTLCPGVAFDMDALRRSI